MSNTITIREQIQRCIEQSKLRNQRLQILLEALPKDKLNTEIDPVQMANEAYNEAKEIGLERFIYEEMDMNSMALRQILS